MKKTTTNEVATNEVATATTTANGLINKSLADSYLDDKGNFTALQYDPETDHENTKLITNKPTAENSAMLCAIGVIAGMVDKAQCYHLSCLKDSVVKNFGFKGIADYCEINFKQAIGDKSRVSRKRNVGKFFVQMYINPDNTSSYMYREGIPFDTTISALIEALPLLTDSDGKFLDFKTIDIDNLAESEIDDIVSRFVADYIETDKLHLCMTSKHVRAEVKKIKGITTETTDTTSSNTKSDSESDNGNRHSETRLESVRACVDRIKNLLGDNDNVKSALATILEVAEKTFAEVTNGEEIAE